jgi:hypothetical protein
LRRFGKFEEGSVEGFGVEERNFVVLGALPGMIVNTDNIIECGNSVQFLFHVGGP